MEGASMHRVSSILISKYLMNWVVSKDKGILRPKRNAGHLLMGSYIKKLSY